MSTYLSTPLVFRSFSDALIILNIIIVDKSYIFEFFWSCISYLFQMWIKIHKLFIHFIVDLMSILRSCIGNAGILILK